MGCDSIILVMQVEEVFGIKIPDERYCEIRTVGALQGLILELMQDQHSSSEKSLSLVTFCELRRSFSQHMPGFPRVRPSSPVAAVIPYGIRPQLWRETQQETGWRLPDLQPPDWHWYAIFFCAFLSWLATIFLLLELKTTSGLVPVAAMLAIPLIAILAGCLKLVLNRLMSHVWVELPRECSTFRGLTYGTLALNYQQILQRHQSQTPQDVWGVLQDIVMDVLNVKREEVIPTARFIEDLGMD